MTNTEPHESKSTLLTEGLFIAGISVYGVAICFALQAGFAEHFNIPYGLIRIDSSTIANTSLDLLLVLALVSGSLWAIAKVGYVAIDWLERSDFGRRLKGSTCGAITYRAIEFGLAIGTPVGVLMLGFCYIAFASTIMRDESSALSLCSLPLAFIFVCSMHSVRDIWIQLERKAAALRDSEGNSWRKALASIYRRSIIAPVVAVTFLASAYLEGEHRAAGRTSFYVYHREGALPVAMTMFTSTHAIGFTYESRANPIESVFRRLYVMPLGDEPIAKADFEWTDLGHVIRPDVPRKRSAENTHPEPGKGESDVNTALDVAGSGNKSALASQPATEGLAADGGAAPLRNKARDSL